MIRHPIKNAYLGVSRLQLHPSLVTLKSTARSLSHAVTNPSCTKGTSKRISDGLISPQILYLHGNSLLLTSSNPVNPSLISLRFLSTTFHLRQQASQASIEAAPDIGTGATSKSVSSTSVDASVTDNVAVSSSGESSSAASNELVLDFIPEKPVPPVESVESISWIGDPPLETLGLGSWWPSGRVQYFLDMIHTGYEIPWWGTIMIATLCMRILTFPLVIKMQRNVAIMNNHNPTMVELQTKITEARKRGDMHDVSMYSVELQKFMKENKLNPLTNFVPMMIQFPIFISMFMGLRQMANLPLESMMTGGLFWFKDLTAADPFYALPILTATSMYLQFKLAADGASLESAGPVAKIVMKVVPFIMVPITMNFPAAITFYWLTTNAISIVQASIVRQTRVREILKIPKMVKWDPKNKPGGNKGIRETFRDIIDNSNVVADIVERRRIDAETFRLAGVGKPKRTYKFDPTRTKMEQKL